ncbi:hypothetical protein BBJ29_006891 [Phytophthora kernoviae]|uniref:sphinganine-1-phosphate aldolase n=1 Tax=Phytophthora kernoviae TaxID=325452 RepID=A0A3R7GMR1_9STRA|nr:hypothetical protein BBJ29_006891 [Phytophthora kernoviae]
MVVENIVKQAIINSKQIVSSAKNVIDLLLDTGAINASDTSVTELQDSIDSNTSCGCELKRLADRVIFSVNNIRNTTPDATIDDIRVTMSESSLVVNDILTVTNNCMKEMLTTKTYEAVFQTRDLLRKTFGVIVDQLIETATTDMGESVAKDASTMEATNMGLVVLGGLDPTGITWMVSQFVQPTCGPTAFIGEIDDGTLFDALGLTTVDEAFEGSYGWWTKKGDGVVNLIFNSSDWKDVTVVIHSGGDTLEEVDVAAGESEDLVVGHLYSGSLDRLKATTSPSTSGSTAAKLAKALTVTVAAQTMATVRRMRYVNRKNLLNVIGGAVINALKQLPIVSSKVAQEMKKIEAEVEHSLKGKDPLAAKMEKLYALPAKGMNDEKLVKLMTDLAGNSDDKWRDGLVSGAVYHGEEDHLEVLNKAYALFSVTNPLHADLWPAVNKFEAEVIAMTASLMNGGHKEVCGTLSSGGTESIFLATKTHREYFRHKHGITKPEIIACVTAHAAIDKACEILGIKLIKVPMDPKTLKVDLAAVRWSISANTIMLYSSAPNFPHGMIDDIKELSSLAVQNDVGLHVDCCLGGFVLPFARQLRPDLPVFDFALPGVTSMSCDTHKYGYAAKGTSVVLYKNSEIRRFQYFSFPDWTGGLYATPTLAGSRPGALSAAAWASLVRLGNEGFLEKTKGILETMDEIKTGIERIDGIHILGDPKAMVVSFAGDKGVNALKVSDAMAKHGWSLSPLQHPTSVHLCVTVRHIGKAQKFLRALEEAVNVVKQDPNPSPEGGSAIYGMASSLPAGPVDDLLRIYTDITLKV